MDESVLFSKIGRNRNIGEVCATREIPTMAEIPRPHTPILDRTSPLPAPAQRSSGSWTVTAVAMCFGAVIGFLAAIGHLPSLPGADRFIRNEFPRAFVGSSGAGVPGMQLLALFVALVAAIVIHEAGHLVAGLLAGFRFSSIRIGPLQIDRPFHVSFHRGGTGSKANRDSHQTECRRRAGFHL